MRGGTGGQQREVPHGSQEAGEEEVEPVVAVGELNFGQRGVAGVDMIAGWKDCCIGDMNCCECGAEGEKPADRRQPRAQRLQSWWLWAETGKRFNTGVKLHFLLAHLLDVER